MTELIKVYNTFVREESHQEPAYYLEEFIDKKWENKGSFPKTQKIGRYIADRLSVGGLNMEYYKGLEIRISNSSPKVSGRNYGLYIASRENTPKLDKDYLRPLCNTEMDDIYNELEHQIAIAKNLNDFLKRITSKDNTIDPGTLQRILWERQVDVGNNKLL